MTNARAAAVLVALAALPVWGQAPSTIRGRVVAADSGEPVGNARVAAPLTAVGTPMVLTDDDGRFSLTVPAGATRIVASKTGYGRSSLTVPAGRETLEIRLQRAAAVSGRIVDEVGEPIQGAHVSARHVPPGSDEAAAGTLTDDRRGGLDLADVKRVVDSRARHLRRARSIDTSATGLARNLASARRRRSLPAQLCERRRPCGLDLRHSRGQRSTPVPAGERGTFSIKGLPFGSYYAVAVDRPSNEGDSAWQDPDFLSGLVRRATTVTVRDGQSQTLDLRIGGR